MNLFLLLLTRNGHDFYQGQFPLCLNKNINFYFGFIFFLILQSFILIFIGCSVCCSSKGQDTL